MAGIRSVTIVAGFLAVALLTVMLIGWLETVLACVDREIGHAAGTRAGRLLNDRGDVPTLRRVATGSCGRAPSSRRLALAGQAKRIFTLVCGLVLRRAWFSPPGRVTAGKVERPTGRMTLPAGARSGSIWRPGGGASVLVPANRTVVVDRGDVPTLRRVATGSRGRGPGPRAGGPGGVWGRAPPSREAGCFWVVLLVVEPRAVSALAAGAFVISARTSATARPVPPGRRCRRRRPRAGARPLAAALKMQRKSSQP